MSIDHTLQREQIVPVSRWPAPDDVPEFFGRFELGKDGHPSDRWEMRNLAQIRLPYPMRLAWQPEVTMIRLRCHKLVARDLSEILSGILAHYGSLSAVQEAGMDLFGGCYFYSAGTDPDRPSPHARGIAIDLDPFGNPAKRRRPRNATPSMPKAVIRIFRAHGWSWGGDAADRYEPAHFEAVSSPRPRGKFDAEKRR
jgi:hypothetical protein